MSENFFLRSNGKIAAEELFKDMSADDIEKLTAIKRRFNHMPFFDLLRYVYNRYPKFAEKSILSI